MLTANSHTLGAATEQAPAAYEPSLAKRIAYSDIVCSVTVVRTKETRKTQVIAGAERDEFIAEAEVHRVFKGTIDSPIVRFRYFRLRRSNGDYFGPPTAFFETGSTYIAFLKDDEKHLEVAVPVFQMEIRTARLEPGALKSTSQSSAAIAEELFYSVRAEPKTIGRMATHYFSWAEEMVGKDAVLVVESFLSSDDELVRYQAAWWLSFRRVSDSVTTVLVKTRNDPSIEEWARSGAEQRLKDMREGLWLPPDSR